MKSWKASNSNLKIELYGIGNKPEKPTLSRCKNDGCCYMLQYSRLLAGIVKKQLKG